VRDREPGAKQQPRARVQPPQPTGRDRIQPKRSRDGEESLYVDGILRVQGVCGGDFSNWDRSFRLALGNEFTHNRAWEGTYHLAAIYNRSLPADEVLRNFRAGTSPP